MPIMPKITASPHAADHEEREGVAELVDELRRAVDAIG